MARHATPDDDRYTRVQRVGCSCGQTHLVPIVYERVWVNPFARSSPPAIGNFGVEMIQQPCPLDPRYAINWYVQPPWGDKILKIGEVQP